MAVTVDLLRYEFAAQDRSRVAFAGLDRSLARVENRAERLKARMLGLGAGIGKVARILGTGIGIAGGASLVGGLGAARREMGELDALSKQIKTSGLSSDLFQTLQFATEEASISQERLNAATLKFTSGLGELRGGFGTLTTALEKLNPFLAQQLRLAETTDEAFLIFADAVKNAANQEEALALVSAVTGKRAAELFRVFALGREGLAATGDKARELGVILEEDLLTRAEELENRFGVAAFTIDRTFKTALIELAPAIVSTVEMISGLARGIGSLIDRVSEFRDHARAVISTRFGERDGLDPRTFFEPFAGFRSEDFVQEVKKTRAEMDAARLSTVKWATSVKDAEPDLQRLASQAQSFGSMMAGAFDRVAFAGDKLSDVVADIGRQLASTAIQRAITAAFSGGLGTGGSGSASLFAGLFAAGGTIPSGKFGIVGERGPEPVFAGNKPLTVLPNRTLNAGGPIKVTVINNGPPMQANARDSADGNGQRSIEVVLDEITGKNMRRFGSASNSALRAGAAPLIER